MRHEKAGALIELARALAASAEGLTLDEMADVAGCGRRTAERMRDALWEVFPQMEAIADGPSKRFRIPGGLDSFVQAPTAEELLELDKAVTGLKGQGATARAQALEQLGRKIRSAMRSRELRRLAPDVDALIRAETLALQAGPRPVEDDRQIATLRHALMAMKRVRFKYRGGSRPGSVREVAPYGLMFGRANYLVAAEPPSAEPRNWRLDRIEDIEVLDEAAAPPDGFSLTEYANRSFGIYQDDIEDVVLRILPHGAEDALVWRFHPNQKVEPQPDGSVLVTFRASGMRELAWHLFTWQDKVEIVQPQILRERMMEELELALSQHRR
ncbi:MAG: WYL domain-containing protein [Proteobacteria bacterium]|nr:WYL domain-containing protein [Pseudomonadota bacterium]